MHYVLAIVIIVFCSFLILVGRRAHAQDSSTPKAGGVLEQIRNLNSSNFAPPVSKQLSRQELAQRLKTLSESAPPSQLNMGAMCYDIAGPPERVDYVCPKCGSRTVYEKNTFFIKYELPKIRELAKQIQGLDLKIDESEFCKKCSRKAGPPELILKVVHPGEKTSHLVRNITDDDLVLLREFLEGKDVHKGQQDRETPLKDYRERIETLLGIKTGQ